MYQSFSGWNFIIGLVTLVVVTAIITAIIVLIIRAASPKRKTPPVASFVPPLAPPPLAPPAVAPPAPAPPSSVATALTTLEDLRTRGLITEAEYAQRRAQIIAGIG